MPIYEYQCNQCRKEFERLVFAGDQTKPTCPECHSRDVVKKMSATSFMGGGLGKCTTGSHKGFS